jgi:hypothetical protein
MSADSIYTLWSRTGKQDCTVNIDHPFDDLHVILARKYCAFIAFQANLEDIIVLADDLIRSCQVCGLRSRRDHRCIL